MVLRNFLKTYVPDETLRRVLYYIKCLNKFKNDGISNIQSNDLAGKCGVKSSVVRKDFSYFGILGVRGKGYDVEQLCSLFKKVLDQIGPINAVVIGAGKLGTALMYHSKENYNIEIIAAFDKSKEKIGKKFSDIPIYDINDLNKFVKSNNIKIVILAIPSEEVQSVVDMINNTGVKLILSLTLTPINAPEGIEVSYFDILSEIEFLFLKLKFKEK